MKRLLFTIFFILFFHLAFAHSRFVVVTPEKTGTHLLTKLLTRLVNKEVQNCWLHDISETELAQLLDASQENQTYIHIHALPTKAILKTLKKKKYKVIFLMRDPRDVIVSLFYYIEKGWSLGPFSSGQPYGKLSKEQKIHELINGERFGMSAVQSIILRRLPWMNQPAHFVFTAHYEKLVGADGGGSNADQLNEIMQIARHINLKIDLSEAEAAAYHLWGANPGERTTFRTGQIGSWQAEFSEKNKQSFKKRFNRLLIGLEYEKNADW